MNQKKNADTLIFSDLHLGSPVCRAREFLTIITSYDFRRLILNGDIFDDLNFNRFNRLHWEVISYIRRLSNPERGIEVIWVLGNHDRGIGPVLSHLLGIKAHRQYIWEYKGGRYLALHGDQFDNFLYKHWLVSMVATFFYNIIQKIDRDDLRFSHLVKRRSKKWLRLSDSIAQSAVYYAKLEKARYVFCGHTHRAMMLDKDGVSYFNSGCWTDNPSNFIVIGDSGIELHECDLVCRDRINMAPDSDE